MFLLSFSFGIIENGLKEWKENGGKKMHLIAFYKSKNDTCTYFKAYSIKEITEIFSTYDLE